MLRIRALPLWLRVTLSALVVSGMLGSIYLAYRGVEAVEEHERAMAAGQSIHPPEHVVMRHYDTSLGSLARMSVIGAGLCTLVGALALFALLGGSAAPVPPAAR